MQRRPKQNLVAKSLNTNVSAVKNEEHNKLIFNLRRFVRNQRKSRNVISKNKKIQKEEKKFYQSGEGENINKAKTLYLGQVLKEIHFRKIKSK